MDEEEVELIDSQIVESLGERVPRRLRLMVRIVELAGDEDLVARQAAVGDRGSDLGFVAVHLGGIDVPVADLQRVADRTIGVLGPHLVGAIPELRNQHPVVQLNGRGR